MIDVTKVFFTKTKNYQKIALKGSSSISVTTGSGYNSVTIPHTLGKITSVRAWYDPAKGYRLPISQEVYTDDTGGGDYANFVMARAYLTTSSLVLQFKNDSGSTKAITYWYRIYYDT